MQYISDDEKRAIYVGLTRARHTLSVHSNVDLSHYMNLMSADFMVDPNTYEEPGEVLMQLSHRDVVLEMFKNKTELIETLHAGQELNINDIYAEVVLRSRSVKTLKLSEAFRRKMDQLTAKGYIPHKASIRHIVYWRYEEFKDGASIISKIPIILPEVVFKKRS